MKVVSARRICRKCGVRGPATDKFFAKAKDCRLGISHTCLSCHRVSSAKISARWRARHPVKHREVLRASRAKLRKEVIAAYGGKCACCRERRIEFLTIEHPLGDGKEHRNRCGKDGHSVYYDLRKRKFPPGFEVLCFNCNFASAVYGTCPHRKDR